MTDAPPREDRSPVPGAARAVVRVVRADAEVPDAVARPSLAPWVRAVTTTGLLVVFVAWGLLFGLGSRSMYLLDEAVGSAQADLMATTSVTLMAVGIPVLLARHRRPVLVTATVAALAAATMLAAGAANGYELAIGAALYAVAAVRSPRTTWLVAGAAVLPLLVLARFAPRVALIGSFAAGARPGDVSTGPGTGGYFQLQGDLATVLPPSWVVTAIPLVVVALLGVTFGTLTRTMRLRAAAVAEAAAARAAEDEQRARVTDAAERARVAREMHDVIAHSLTVMIALGGGASAALDRSPEQARRALDELVATGRGALEDVRRILGVLHAPAAGAAPHDSAEAPEDGWPGGAPRGAGASDDASAGEVPMAPQPGVTDLGPLVDRFRATGLPVRTAGLAVTGAETLDASVQLAVYRIVQESLTNTLRHAPGTAGVEVAVHRTSEAVEVVVTDQGPGGTAAAPSPGTGRGIVGMTGRAAAFGGTVETGPHGAGWRVRAVLPLGRDAQGGTAPVRGDLPAARTVPSARPAPSGEAVTPDAVRTNEGEA